VIKKLYKYPQIDRNMRVHAHSSWVSVPYYSTVYKSFAQLTAEHIA